MRRMQWYPRFFGPIFEIAQVGSRKRGQKRGHHPIFFSLSHFQTFSVRKLNQTALEWMLLLKKEDGSMKRSVLNPLPAMSLDSTVTIINMLPVLSKF